MKTWLRMLLCVAGAVITVAWGISSTHRPRVLGTLSGWDSK